MNIWVTSCWIYNSVCDSNISVYNIWISPTYNVKCPLLLFVTIAASDPRVNKNNIYLIQFPMAAISIVTAHLKLKYTSYETTSKSIIFNGNHSFIQFIPIGRNNGAIMDRRWSIIIGNMAPWIMKDDHWTILVVANGIKIIDHRE